MGRLPRTIPLAVLLCVVATASGAPSSATTQPLEDRIRAGRQSWAFSAPKEPVVPSVVDASWCKSPIDRFILAKLDAQGLKPAAPANKRTLIRRAFFDLIGLPPKPEEIDAFLHDDSPDAFAKVVDHLLNSPHYGERWARHWLDVVRYTDSNDARGVGSEGDIAFAWRYRDWVVKALNQDLPYDQFVMQQIAGDLLPAKDPSQFNADGLVATCMYVIGNWPGGDADRRKMMTDIVDDQVDVTGRAFLGVTLACARCHDHKFDPISQRDYYGMAGIFFSSHFLPSPGSPTSGSAILRFPIASPAELERRKVYGQKVADAQKRMEDFADAQYVKLAKSLIPRTGDYVSAALELAQHGAPPQSDVDRYAADRKLDSYYLSRWVSYLGSAAHTEPTRKLLTKANHNIAGIPGVDGWIGVDGRPDPCVLANNTDHPVSFSTLTLPAKSISMHPGPTSGVAVGWTSPVAGSVRITGRVIDGDPNCGDGIDWRIEHGHANRLQPIASGAFPNGGRQELADGDSGKQSQTIDVAQGDMLQLTIFPKGNYSCDTTIIELEIAERDGTRTWNLSRDVVPDLLVGEKGNPHADSLGNPGTWRFFETGSEEPATGAAPGSSLANLLDTAPDDRAPQVAELTNALLALDQQNAPTGPDAKLYKDLVDPKGPFWGEAPKQNAHLPQEATDALARMSQELAGLKKDAPPPVELANALTEGGVPQSEYAGTHDGFILNRGRYDRKGDPVPRSFPVLLAGDTQPHISQGSGRVELARWVASASNPMTAKVMANRIWQHHFGEGIVRTPNNFGRLGVDPTHPELLNYLARRFVENGWSIKSLHRLIMLSAAYQQSSVPDEKTLAADPDNTLFGHMNRQRQEAEPFRDALLAVSGKLDETMGGVAYRDFNTPRRTLYLMTIRSDRTNFRMLFDAADPTSIVDQRIDSTVAPQALFLMNNPLVIDRSRALADRALKQGPDDRARINWLYETLYARPAADREIEIGLAATRSGDEAWQRYCQVLLCANEFVYVD
jgi:hypothetical protein